MSYYRTSNGGWNKSHGTVEKAFRIDSFDEAVSEGGGTLFAYADGVTQPIDCTCYTEYGPSPETDREIVELWGRNRIQTLKLSRKANGFGGNQVFFLCPDCGRRVRYLYFNSTGRLFKCRKCSRLNYRSQQETRSDSMFYYGKGVDFANKHLYTWPRVHPDGFSFCDWIPSRPRYMHRTTYGRYLKRFLRYRGKYSARMLADLERLLRGFR